ncbi:MAG: 2-oxoacid:acceptor oxidoreductase subunit alpha [Anaerolineae bacterium]
MATAVVGAAPQSAAAKEREIVNDFAIVAATVNGTGSATANSTLLRALFHMGIPVTGKNLFPSNIYGLPTWYTIRISKDGYLARREGTEVLIAFNERTVAQDIANLPSGGVCFYSDELKTFNPSRDDITYYKLPVKDVVKEITSEALSTGLIQKEEVAKLKDYLPSMTYVGVVSQMLGIDLEELRKALSTHFRGKAKPIELNYGVVSHAAQWARENLTKQDPYRVERMDVTADKIMIDGNTAAALGALYGGMTVAAWYPITPASSLAENLIKYGPRLRMEDGKATYAIVQAEDELAALGIVMGAGWAGARAMTSTSGPGISLMAEFAGFGFYTEIPAVIWDVMRMGPSTGLPTRVSQGDILSTYFLSHGDTRHPCLLPGSVKECFEFGALAFNVAEELQTPVFVLSDLDLGMNLWLSDPFDYPTEPINRGKVLDAETLERMPAWGRYKDVDGDGVPYRTLPGTPSNKAAYFTRGSGHNEYAQYTERGDDWVKNMDRLFKKHETAKTLVPQPIIEQNPNAKIGIISYGSNDPGVREGRDRLAKEGIETSYLRLRALPITDAVREFIAAHDRTYVVEMNHEGQMAMILRMDLPDLATRIIPIAFSDGLPLTARFVMQNVIANEKTLGGVVAQ